MKKVNNWKQLRNHPAVERAYVEDDYGISYWINLKEGYINTDMECGLVHERTKQECINVFNNYVTLK